jgi:hypothetical protein
MSPMRAASQRRGEGGGGQLPKPTIDRSPSRDRPHLGDSAEAENCPAAEARPPCSGSPLCTDENGGSQGSLLMRRGPVWATGSKAGIQNENIPLRESGDRERWSEGGVQKGGASVGSRLELGQFD